MDGGMGSWAERRARIAPEHTALIHGDGRWTYGELAGRVRSVAHRLQELGVERGDRVGWLGANHPAFLELLFATAKVGAILAPVNHHLDHSVIAGVLDDYSAKVVVVGEDAVDIPRPRGVRARVVVGAAGGSDVPYDDLVAPTADGPVDELVQMEDVGLLAHTSGTTGSPKGVMLTHANITWNVINLLSVVDVCSDDVTIAIAPFFRTGGTGVNVLPVLFKGGTVVIPQSSESDHLLGLFEQQKITVGFGNPDLLEAFTGSPAWPTTDFSSIRCFITGGAPVPERLMRLYFERGIPLLQGYGLSEAAPFVMLLDAPSALRKVGSAGKPALFVDVRTVRPDGSECAENETGELVVRGPNVMVGYWNRPDATREALDGDGWLHTGDAARLDDEGYAWIVDRVADAYQSGGHVVYPGDVERVFGRHPAVADVGVVTRLGVPVAYVVVAAGSTTSEHELLDFCRTRLAPHEMPSAVVFVDELPRSSVGKLLRHRLAEAARSPERGAPASGVPAKGER